MALARNHPERWNLQKRVGHTVKRRSKAFGEFDHQNDFDRWRLATCAGAFPRADCEGPPTVQVENGIRQHGRALARDHPEIWKMQKRLESLTTLKDGNCKNVWGV